ncbi:hypothetical protein Daus18300_013678 [Diaporthe australafricana]|uniref:GED domain-containing protein n=1 Tax=Diaporthe australafricana TaxID=127596 RepID=A0ABR3VY39_9PEZI
MLPSGTGLGNQATLAKIDKLRELNVGAIIPLPQITCCCEAEKGIVVSIIPRPDADERLKTKLLQFKRHLSSIDSDELASVFEEANIAMGIRMGVGEKDVGLAAFSQDTLKIEQEHLTIINVPGIFRVPTPGLTTETDIVLVENMVKSYIANPRTIILAVISCTVDIATQEILKLAEGADPKGVRTMGVLTKPDLVTETATRGAIIDLVLGRRSTLKLGYYVVKNRSADDNASTLSERAAAEQSVFTAPAWSPISERCGTTTLKLKVCELLMHISKQEFPRVKADTEQRLRQCRADLETMGPSRADSNSQRMYLGKLASRFLAITQAALNGYYAGDSIFKRLPNLKLITKIMKLNEVFSNVFWKRGHKQHFGPTWDDEGESLLGRNVDQLPFGIPLNEFPEIGTIIRTDGYQCPKPLKGPIMNHVEEVFESSRGPELGTFGGTILATVFEEQSEKWEPLVLSHISNTIALVHEYIFQLLTELCPDKQKKRSERMSKTFEAMAISSPWSDRNDSERYVPMSKIGKHAVDKDNGQQVCEDILDTLMSYYKVSRKRFVDVICQQVVFHLMLEGDGSPLKVFDPELIMNLDTEQLEQIAGEEVESKYQRHVLKREMESLEAALKILRS